MPTKRCCCNIPGGCDVAEDDFNRPDNADPGPLWTEVDTGDAEMLSNRLRMNSGLVVTSARQIPPIAPGTNYAHSVVVTCSRALSHTVFEIVLNFSDEDNYSLVRMTYNGTHWEPEFANVSGGSETVVADKNSHPQTGLFSSDVNGNLRIQICYAEAEWTISDVNSQQAWTICGATPRTTLPADTSHGLVGFRGTGLYDDWDYNVHWESRRECFPCSCFCRLTDTDFLCVPEELKLTWVPTSGAFCETNPMGGTDCCPTPFSTEMTLYQQLPTTPAPSSGPSFTAPTFGASRKTASKLVWRSGLLQFEAGNPNINGTPHWVMLVCDLNERNFYLLIDQYPWNDPFLAGTGAPGGLGYNGQKLGWASPDLGTSGSSGGARSAKYANKARSTCDPLTLTFEGLTYTRSSLGPLCEAYGSTYEAVVTEP